MSGSGGAPGTEVAGAGEVARRRVKSARGVVATLLALMLIAFALAALRPPVQAQHLDPESPTQSGSRALAELVRQRGGTVTVARTADAAARAARTDSVLVVVRTERLGPAQLTRLRGAPGDLLLVEPTAEALRILAPQVRPATRSAAEFAEPDCAVPAVAPAGRVEFGRSATYEVTSASSATPLLGCYFDEEFARLVQQRDGLRTVTVVGSGTPFTNAKLESEGNAALALNLAGARSSMVWFMPGVPEPADEAGDESFFGLVPFGVRLAVLQLLIAVLLVAVWRARRLGPVVAEPLPVAVRSAETVEGRSRLYRAHQARDRAADALRSGTRERLVPLLGMPRSAAHDPAYAGEIVTAVAARTRWDEATIGSALYGPEPADDAQLVGLTDFLDDLERQVRAS